MIASDKAKRTFNPIRNVVDHLRKPKNHCKQYINLALGDPTVHGNLKCPTVLESALHEALSSSESNGYGPSIGCSTGRKAIASKVSRQALDALSILDNDAKKRSSSIEINEDDVIITSGWYVLYMLLNIDIYITMYHRLSHDSSSLDSHSFRWSICIYKHTQI
jgi:aspartate/methionine/tyrosine aminotransferase